MLRDMLGFRQNVHPPYVKEYLERFEQDGHSEEMISLDLETTDIRVKHAEVLSLGMVPLGNRKILIDQASHAFFAVRQQDRENTKVHEIIANSADLSFQDYLPDFLGSLTNKVILGHHIQYDINVINRQLKIAGLPKLKNRMVDTLQMMIDFDRYRDLKLTQKGQYSLYNCCERFGIEVSQTHDALNDAYLTALLYLHLNQ